MVVSYRLLVLSCPTELVYTELSQSAVEAF